MSWLQRLVATFHPSHLDTAIDDEIRFHLEQRERDLIAQGATPADARREAARMFGNRCLHSESTRERDLLVWLESAGRDLRYAVRMLRRRPGFAAAAVLSLALGIGGNTALFSLLDSLLLRMLPVQEPQRLVRLSEGSADAFAYPVYETLRTGSRTLSGVAAMVKFYRDMPIEERGETRVAAVQAVSGDYFDTLGVAARMGRMFHAADAISSEARLAVISDAWWNSHYARDPSALGAHFRRNNLDYVICGIAPTGFQGAMVDAPVEIWIAADPMGYSRGRALILIGRLQPGVSPSRAAAEVGALLGRAIQMVPAGTGISSLRGRYSRPLILLECVAGLVLLIACANLANLLLASAAYRAREMTLRQAIGAGRGRLVRQLLSESLAVSLAGAALAVPLAKWLSRAILRFLPPDASPAVANLSFQLDAHALGFTAGLAVVTCLLFGLAPALRGTRARLTPGFKETGEHGSGRWTSRGLVVGEVALCTLLLMGAGLFVRTLQNLRASDSGFAPEHVLVAATPTMRGSSKAQVFNRVEALLQQVAAVPGVRVAGFSNIGLLSGFGVSWRVAVDGYLPKPGEELQVNELRISPGFFAAMGTPLLAGRDFTARDDSAAPPAAIVNESFARKFFENKIPLGRRFSTDEQPPVRGIEIVGVVKDAKLGNLREPVSPIFYRPYRQSSVAAVTLAVRATGDLTSIAASLRRLNLKDVVPFTEIEDRTLATERLVAQVSTAFGALALVVACVGIYGVLAYGVARRTREIGVRMALGATRAQMEWMVLRESLLLLGFGALLAIPAVLLGQHYIASMLFGVPAADIGTISTVVAVMLTVALAAAWIPARRAAGIDPMEALRCE